MGWSEEYWATLDTQTRRQALAAQSDAAAWEISTCRARQVLRSFSTSFFIVTRFLPPAKRAQVEAVYAAVRYPDEVVDTFPLRPAERDERLEQWAAAYETALGSTSLREMLQRGAPVFIAAFCRVVKDCGIPAEHYRAFLAAMRHDIRPRRFETLDELIEQYIYGSAIVVGYFLTYVYGAATPGDFNRALHSARNLGIALQLTNFLRDVSEDQRRGRLYLPLEMLREEGVDEVGANDLAQHAALGRVRQRLTLVADEYYARAGADLDAFSPDCRIAIRACIDVYGQLNRQIAQSQRGIQHRESVPAYRKFQVLPPSKYWVLPLAYLKT
ncbi:MAG TPA: phytoene/squalene synthase family protein [Blastocatellia bacterium]|nr:phytoene/squalene synthase family protein [Blastocatellia bacterium]